MLQPFWQLAPRSSILPRVYGRTFAPRETDGKVSTIVAPMQAGSEMQYAAGLADAARRTMRDTQRDTDCTYATRILDIPEDNVQAPFH